MHIYLGADHGGFACKSLLHKWLESQGYTVIDCGAAELDPDDDYPTIAFKVAQAVVAHAGSMGVLLCRSGAGMTIAANKVSGIRAANIWDVRSARHAREHNDANVLALSAEWLSPEQMQEVVHIFLTTPFSMHERHQRRLAQIKAYEAQFLLRTPTLEQNES